MQMRGKSGLQFAWVATSVFAVNRQPSLLGSPQWENRARCEQQHTSSVFFLRTVSALPFKYKFKFADIWRGSSHLKSRLRNGLRKAGLTGELPSGSGRRRDFGEAITVMRCIACACLDTLIWCAQGSASVEKVFWHFITTAALTPKHAIAYLPILRSPPQMSKWSNRLIHSKFVTTGKGVAPRSQAAHFTFPVLIFVRGGFLSRSLFRRMHSVFVKTWSNAINNWRGAFLVWVQCRGKSVGVGL